MKEVFIDMLSAVRVIRQLYHELEGDIAIKHGLTKGESSVLAFIHNNPGADTLSDIVYGRRLRKGNVSMAISSLEKKGLLCRKADEKDRRVTHLVPLPAADKFLSELMEATDELCRKVLDGLSPEDVEVLDGFFVKLDENGRKLYGRR